MKTPTSPTDRAGFTLLELTVVVMIVGLAAALVFSNLDRMLPRQRLRAAAAELTGAVESARGQARLRQVPVSLEYDLDARSWTIYAPPADAGDDDEDEDEAAVGAAAKDPAASASGTIYMEAVASRVLPRGVGIRRIYYSESGVAAGGTVAADFRPSGAVGEHMVILEEDSGAAMTVFVPALTGAAFVMEGEASYAETRLRRRLK